MGACINRDLFPFSLSLALISKISGSSESGSYPAQADNSNSTTPHQNGFLSRSPQKIQTEPVDFSGSQPVDFSGPRMGFGIIGPTPYSRESTPDSGNSHYIDNFRDPSGKKLLYKYLISLPLSHRISGAQNVKNLNLKWA